ncbi:MAG: hypothetical protein IPM97_01290 [Bdellovibrionaceae bacterium]|nr:hypothetical protein [Pseudobdellovibrionaceae bacterium]
MNLLKPTVVTLTIFFTAIASFGGVADKINSLGLSTLTCKVSTLGIFNANGVWSTTDERNEITKIVIASNQKEAIQILLNKLIVFKIKTDQEYFVGQGENDGLFAITDISCK